ncbi:hypothetical protein K3495_g9405 [Podosphaera aphanis]|nr:hypothetical protein K3495_g9405 [Podosphaera aphanis]
MAFPIELPGESAPLTAEQVAKALISAVSSHQLSIQTGTQQLKAWEGQRNYFSLLQGINLFLSLPSEVRHLAIIQLKNGVDKYWRRVTTKTIVAEEKSHIRSRLLEGVIMEKEDNLSLQCALLVSKVVRIDYPNEWPEVLPNLIKNLRDSKQSNNQFYLQRGLLILTQIIKELSKARLPASQAKVVSIALELIIFMTELYIENVTFWSSSLRGQIPSEGEKIAQAMKISLVTIKILRRLMVIGFERPNHSAQVETLWRYSQTQFGQFLEMTHGLPLIPPLARGLIESHLLQLSKMHLEMAKKHPAAFILLPNSLDLVRAYWGLAIQCGESLSTEKYAFHLNNSKSDKSEKSESSSKEQLCLKSLNIMRACIQIVFNRVHTFKYMSPKDKVEEKQAIALVQTELLSTSLIQEIANVIVTKFFVFRQGDLEAWEDDQEEWELREESRNEIWEFELRPCSEKLFMDVVINYKDLLLSPLLSYFSSVSTMEQDNIVMKDAIYTAMGLSSSVVCSSFDFDTFLASTLVSDIQRGGPGYKILRRRIAILLGQWLSIKVSNKSRLIAYQIFQHLLSDQDKTNDLVVRICAARQLKQIVNDFDFDAQQFIPYASDIIGRIIGLVHEVEAVETKIVILRTIGSIVNQMGKHIIPFADQIVSMLVTLWQAAGEEYLLKQSIFSILSSIVSSLQSSSERYYSLIVPLIANSLAADSETRPFLWEDALELWNNVLETTPSTAPSSILSLFDNIFHLLEVGSEELRGILQILDGYCILAPQHVLSDTHRFRLLSSLTPLVGINKHELAGLVATIIKNLIRAANTLGGTQGIILIVKDLHKSGLLTRIFTGLRDAWECHQILGMGTHNDMVKGKRTPIINDAVETDYFTIIARLAEADPVVFADMLSLIGPFDEVWPWLSTEWFRHFDCIANLEEQKLSCLALTRMLELPPQILNFVLAKLQDYFSMWTQAIAKIMEHNETLDGLDLLVLSHSDLVEGGNDDAERRRQWKMADSVHRIPIHTFVKEKLALAIENSGGDAKFADEWLINVDEDVVRSFRSLDTTRRDKQ